MTHINAGVNIHKNQHLMGLECLNRPHAVKNHPEPCKANADIELTILGGSENTS